MVRMFVLINVILVTLPLLEVLAGDDDEGETEMCTCIALGIKEDVKQCPNADSVTVVVDLKMNLQQSDNEDEADCVKLDGSIEATQEIKDSHEIRIGANLITENGMEPVFSCMADVCSSMKDEDAPWYPILKYFETTSCPIEAKVYDVEGLKMELGCIDGILTPEFCGEYLIEIAITKGLDTVMCILMGAEIFEVEKPCEECPEKQRKRK
ncbi:uncharacterized protein LOC126368493 [Pectinophora gossypiella]|uniref:uncharacterized protein LOC126368493 n=1 Tax=Pectinophora gossypiella TaxID=13191 RepID=UPI00214E546F|nr:uncharacterized protein LOC126368493 [Pectinophora gossypiella]